MDSKNCVVCWRKMEHLYKEVPPLKILFWLELSSIWALNLTIILSCTFMLLPYCIHPCSSTSHHSLPNFKIPFAPASSTLSLPSRPVLNVWVRWDCCFVSWLKLIVGMEASTNGWNRWESCSSGWHPTMHLQPSRESNFSSTCSRRPRTTTRTQISHSTK